ncbi:MAG: restriction endonuclease [Bacteroidota bacterium]
MIIDFKEIAKANRGGGQQDTFEQFARDFFLALGYKIDTHPGRGADGGKDLIVSEKRSGISNNETLFRWLVSCKHYAHSNRAVSINDEIDIKGRVDQHNCNGFLGFYSTIPSSPLNEKLDSLMGNNYDILDSRKIEKELLVHSPKRQQLIIQYFPDSYTKYKHLIESSVDDSKQNKINNFSEEDILRITKTAIVLIDIEKIKEEYYSTNDDWNESVLNKLNKYVDHSNEKIARAIFYFLSSLAEHARAGMPSSMASTIYALVLAFFPSSYETQREERIENGKLCIYIGFSLAYYAFIYLKSYKIGMYALLIWKFIYRESRRNNMPELEKAVMEEYDKLEEHITRQAKDNLDYAKKFLNIFKKDLKTPNLDSPPLPKYLYKLYNEN